MSKEILSVGIYANENNDLRVRAGRLLDQVLDPRNAVFRRRVETISLTRRNINERRVSVDIDRTALTAAGTDSEVEIDKIPLGIILKSVHYDFDVRGRDGTAHSVVSREFDSRAAQCHLVAIALDSDSSLEIPSERIWKLIYECVFRFPREDAGKTSMKEKIKTRGAVLTAAKDLAWWEKASNTPRWIEWFNRYEESYLLFVDELPEALPGLLKFRYLESKVESGPRALRELLRTQARPNKGLAFRVNDLGRASSDHIRVLAPEGVFLADGSLNRRGSVRKLHYRVRSSRNQIAFYVRGAPARNATILATMWPESRGFIIPLRFLALYSFGIVVVATILQFQTGIVGPLRPSLDAVLAFAFLLPTPILGLLYHATESEIRWGLLRIWRRLAAACVGVLWLAAAILFGPVSHDMQRFLGWAFLLLALIAGSLWLIVEMLARQIANTATLVRRQELAPAKGESLGRSALE